MVVALLLACGGEPAVVEPVDTGAPPQLEPAVFLDVCEAEFQHQLPPFDVHFAVLTDSPAAPTGEESVTDCPPGDTRWPCSHITALTETFITAQGAPVCDPAAPEQCVTFRYKSHRTFAEVSQASGCRDVLAAARGVRTPTTDAGSVISGLREATTDCTDPDIIDPYAMNVLLFDQPISGSVTSFATAFTNRWSVGCAPYVYVEVARLPPSPGEAFYYAVNEHEVGHIFGLDHVCDGPRTPGYPDTNIMQGTGSSCCCECGPDIDADPKGLWATQICADCSGLDPSDACDERPGGQCNEPDCTSQISNGNRNLGFTDDVLGSARTGHGQITQILEMARDQHACWCRTALSQGHTRFTVEGEATCSPGSGLFRLAALDAERPEQLTPLRVSGDVLSPLAEVEISGVAGETVSLSWTCPTGTPPVLESRRPGVAYRLPLAALGSDLEDAVWLRIDQEKQQLWIELEGQPGVARVVPLSGDERRWRWSGPGRKMHGTLAEEDGALRIEISTGETIRALEISRKLIR